MTTGPAPEQSLSQRELRNESGRVLRAVSEGSSFLLTTNGVPVARIVPVDAPSPTLASTRPARRVGGWSLLGIVRTVTNGRSTSAILDELRSDRL